MSRLGISYKGRWIAWRIYDVKIDQLKENKKASQDRMANGKREDLGMTDQVWKRENVSSPCINICVVHPQERICTGCLRSIDEIGAWSRLSEEERQQIMTELPNRASRLKKRRGGRKARIA